MGGDVLKTRKLALGDRNLIGARVTQRRLELGMKQTELLAQLQLAGVDMTTAAPVNEALKLFGELIDEMEELMA